MSKEFKEYLKKMSTYSEAVFDGTNTLGTVHNWFGAVATNLRTHLNWSPRHYFGDLSEHAQRYTLFLKDNLFRDTLPARFRTAGRMSQSVSEYDVSIDIYKALRDKFGQALCYYVLNWCVAKSLRPIIEKRLDDLFPDRVLSDQPVGTMTDYLALKGILSESSLTLPPSLVPNIFAPVHPEIASNPVQGSTLRLFGSLKRESSRVARILLDGFDAPDDVAEQWYSHRDMLAVVDRIVLYRHLGAAVSRATLAELRSAGLVLVDDANGKLRVSFDIPIPADDPNHVVSRLDTDVHSLAISLVREDAVRAAHAGKAVASTLHGSSRKRAKQKQSSDAPPAPQKRSAEVLSISSSAPKKRSSKTLTPRTSTRDIATVRCFNCGKLGHYSPSCEMDKGPRCEKCGRRHLTDECLGKSFRASSSAGAATKKGRGASK